jgi:phage major head subunit gpT-like protein
MIPSQANTHISTDWGDLLLPGLRDVFYNTYNEMPTQFDKIFKVKDSKQATEKELGMGAMTPWTERVNETDNVTYQKISEGLLRTYTHKEFASGFAVGKRLYEDELYGIINGMSEDLGRAGRTKVETDVATVFNNAFDATNYPIYDGVALISASHPYEGGKTGTQSNLVEGALSDTTLKTAITLMRSALDNGGKKIVLTPDTLVVPPALEWTALTLVQSSHKPGTDYNDINTLAGKLKVVVYDYLTDDDAWFVLDSKRHKLTYFWRVKPEFEKGKDSDNFVAKYNGRMRYSYGASAWQGIVGSSGA